MEKIATYFDNLVKYLWKETHVDDTTSNHYDLVDILNQKLILKEQLTAWFETKIYHSLPSQKKRIYKKIKDDMYGYITRRNIMRFLENNLIENREDIITLLHWQGSLLQYLTDELRDDREIVCIASFHDPGNAIYASERLRNDVEFIIDRIRWSEQSMIMVPRKFKINKKFLIELGKIRGTIIFFVSSHLMKDRELIIVCLMHWTNDRIFPIDSVKYAEYKHMNISLL